MCHWFRSPLQVVMSCFVFLVSSQQSRIDWATANVLVRLHFIFISFKAQQLRWRTELSAVFHFLDHSSVHSSVSACDCNIFVCRHIFCGGLLLELHDRSEPKHTGTSGLRFLNCCSVAQCPVAFQHHKNRCLLRVIGWLSPSLVSFRSSRLDF